MLSKMKKYFLMCATLVAALNMMSCKTDEPQPPVPPQETKFNLDEAVYYGEKIAKDVGYYTINLVDANNSSNKLRLDMFATAVEPTAKPKLTAGTYNLGTVTEPTTKTFFVAANGEETQGTLYWNDGTPVLISGGTINVQSAAAGYTIKVELTAGDQTIKGKFSGAIEFKDEREDAPRTAITTGAYMAQYLGEYALANEQLGQLLILMQDADNQNQQLQLNLTIAYPTEGDYPADYVTIPTGTFEVVANPQQAGQVIPTTNQADETYSAEIVYKNGMPAYGVLIQGGSVTITKEGEKYNITTDLEGTKFTITNNKLEFGKEVTGIEWNLTDANFGEYVLDMTAPVSMLTEDLHLENLSSSFFDVWGVTQTSFLWRIIFHEDTLSLSSQNDYYNQDGTLYVGGEGGDVLMVQLISGSEKFPTGTFDMESSYDYLYPVGKTQSGKPIINIGGADPLGLGVGSWYFNIGPNDAGQMATLVGAGAVCKQGSVKIDAVDASSYLIDIELFDKYGHTITGTFTLAASQESATFSSTDKPVVRMMPNTLKPYSFESHNGIPVAFR